MSEWKPTGIILWQGKSLIDGQRIVAIATGVLGSATKNRKTGDMIQTYILRRDIHPMLARRMGEDKSVCGDCKHREQSTCYVNLCHGPINIFWAWTDGHYKQWEDSDIEYFRGRNIRIGSYGDPAAVPFEIWENICNVAYRFTGYTHQWKKCDPRLQKICMASVDSIQGYMKEYVQAKAMGWRTFRIRESLDNELVENEFVCPASKEGGNKTTCEKCGSCCGHTRNTKKCPVIMLHADSEVMGAMWRRDRYIKIMKAIKTKHKWRRDYKAERKVFLQVCKF